MKQKILLVDDEADALEVLGYNLAKAGYEPILATDGHAALQLARDQRPALVVLDLMLPGMDGLDVCRILRSSPETASLPIIMLTAKAAETDRIVGLEIGADDYVTKPFSPRELLLRIKKLLARTQLTDDPSSHLRVGDLDLDSARHTVLAQGKPVVLTATEFRLLELLLRRRGRVQSRERLLTDVWGYENVIDTRTVDTHMRRLREKLGPSAALLETVRGVGYRCVNPA
ncbi:MAG: response regulator [Opitutaceae bacterium]|nr:response regulator [Opitutaceae bacterium]